MESEIWKVYRVTKSGNQYFKAGIWEVSNQGNVRQNGVQIDLSKYNHQNYIGVGGFYVHRAVAELFIPNSENKPEVDHINTNKHDNRAINLRWTTSKENRNNKLTQEHQSKSQKVAQNRPEVKTKKSIASKKIQKDVQSRPEVKAKIGESSKDRCHMTNGIDRVFIKPELVDYYLERGYHFGMK